jgi:2-oxoglutarate ferredoxin oxidoreductase subunit alpha
VYIVDQNRDGQMRDLLKLDIAIEHIAKLRSVRHYNGLPIDARSITDDIISQEGK